jgi:hypothetical protein
MLIGLVKLVRIPWHLVGRFILANMPEIVSATKRIFKKSEKKTPEK